MPISWPTRTISDAERGSCILNQIVDTSESRGVALLAAQAAADKQASDIAILELGDLIGITDFFVIVSATNDRQLRTVTEEVEQRLKQRGGRAPKRREGTKETGWMLLDYGDVVVHAFTDEQRTYYSLERLWADAPTVPFDERYVAEAIVE